MSERAEAEVLSLEGDEPKSPAPSYRGRRLRVRRARTVSTKRMTKRELEIGRLLYPDVDGVDRPKTRDDCLDMPRPCPFVSCRYHLYLDVMPDTGSIKLNFPDLEPEELTHSCALDVADDGGDTLEKVGAMLNVTRERLRQIEAVAMGKVAATRSFKDAMREYADDGPEGKRRLPLVGGRRAAETFRA